MKKARYSKGGRPASGGWLSIVLALAMMSFSLACVLHENDNPPEDQESTYGWTWVAGSSSAAASGVYGTKGVASTSNIPGARGYHTILVDASSRVWLFGGHGYDSTGASGHMNDLWRYDQTARSWTWVAGGNVKDISGSYGTKGVASVSNIPGSRDSVTTWKDSSGNLWLFGGFGFDAAGATGNLNDLWKFDPATLAWTWVSGSNAHSQAGIYGTKGTAAPANTPGARFRTVSWIDSDDKLWLFGGFGIDSGTHIGDLNDLWMFDPLLLEWTWVGGSDQREQPGFYGAKGVTSPSNIPGARDAAASWQGADGKFYLFGGEGFDGFSVLGELDDLWVFDPATEQWTWIAGNNIVNQIGIYGTQGVASPANVPGGGNGGLTWVDSTGRLLLFGGRGYDSAGNFGLLNDLWLFDPASGQWAWIFGSRISGQRGHFGALGKRYLTNSPGGRYHTVGWMSQNGELWLLGGEGFDASGAMNYLNDLWKYTR